MKEPDRLPKGWAPARLSDFCEVVMGQAPPGDTYNEAGDGLPFFQGKADFGDLYPVPVKFCSAPSRIAEKNDVLLSVRAPVGPTNLAPGPCCIGRGLVAIRPLAGILSRYVLYALRNTAGRLAEGATGSTFPGVTGEQVREHELAVAAFAEQHRIVAEIEKQFTRLDAAVAALERVKANLKRYRASVLKAACEGRLVPREAELARAEGRDYEPADQLLAQVLARHDGDGRPKATNAEGRLAADSEATSGPTGWCWTTLGSLIEEGLQNGLYKPQASYGQGAPVVRIDDYQDDRPMRPANELKRLRVSWIEASRYALREGDILVNRVNSAPQLGKAYAVDASHEGCIFESNIMRFRVAPGVRAGFVVTWLRSLRGRAFLTTHAKWAVNQASINQSDVRSTPIPLPPSAEQERIVAEVERRVSVVDELETQVEASLKRAERLRQAILKLAFEGRLVPQDPNDEPASVLLERIRAERERGTLARRVPADRASRPHRRPTQLRLPPVEGSEPERPGLA